MPAQGWLTRTLTEEGPCHRHPHTLCSGAVKPDLKQQLMKVIPARIPVLPVLRAKACLVLYDSWVRAHCSLPCEVDMRVPGLRRERGPSVVYTGHSQAPGPVHYLAGPRVLSCESPTALRQAAAMCQTLLSIIISPLQQP